MRSSLWIASIVTLTVVVAVALGLVAWWWWRRRVLAPLEPAPRLPVVLVHGIMGFDEIGVLGWKHDYFRGVIAALAARGVKTYQPRLPPAASVPERAKRLADFVRALPEARVTIVAHSMGGLDARYAIARLGLAERVAALVTVATPHRGTPLAVLAGAAPMRLLRRLAAHIVGLDTSGVEWLTPRAAEKFNAEVPDDGRVKYHSVIARARPRVWWKSPWVVPSWLYLHAVSGHSDGMVPSESQRWGETLFEIDVDHFAQIGWSFELGAAEMYERILRALAERGY
jgi:triacylglycerol lipase